MLKPLRISLILGRPHGKISLCPSALLHKLFVAKRLRFRTLTPKLIATGLCVLTFYLLFLEIFVPRIVFNTNIWPQADVGFIVRLIEADFPPRNACDSCTFGTTTVHESGDRTVFQRTGISCELLFKGDDEEQFKAKEYMKSNEPQHFTDDYLLSMTQNCRNFTEMRGYPHQPASEDEAKFPIAYSILVKNEASHAERLLKAIYAPQNYYCIHVDLKSDPVTMSVMRNIASCFENVFIASNLETVFWGHVSIVYAEINCMKDLLKFNWKYFINLSGQMFPTRGNAEIVQILKLYNGANDVSGSAKKRTFFTNILRSTFAWRLLTPLEWMMITPYWKGTPPNNVTIYKGFNHSILTRAFVVYFLYSRSSRELLEWLADTMVPDEFIWPTLNHNPHLYAPGAYKGDPETKPFTARLTLWKTNETEWQCQGKYVRRVCIFGVDDLQWLHQRPELFINKFHSDYEWLALDCMEELARNRTLAQQGNEVTYDLTYYEQMPFVRNKTLVVSVEEALKHWH